MMKFLKRVAFVGLLAVMGTNVAFSIHSFPASEDLANDPQGVNGVNGRRGVVERAGVVLLSQTHQGYRVFIGENFRGEYSVPGGECDPQDGNYYDTALRELIEETGGPSSPLAQKRVEDIVHYNGQQKTDNQIFDAHGKKAFFVVRDDTLTAQNLTAACQTELTRVGQQATPTTEIRRYLSASLDDFMNVLCIAHPYASDNNVQPYHLLLNVQDEHGIACQISMEEKYWKALARFVGDLGRIFEDPSVGINAPNTWAAQLAQAIAKRQAPQPAPYAYYPMPQQPFAQVPAPAFMGPQQLVQPHHPAALRRPSSMFLQRLMDSNPAFVPACIQAQQILDQVAEAEAEEYHRRMQQYAAEEAQRQQALAMQFVPAPVPAPGLMPMYAPQPQQPQQPQGPYHGQHLQWPWQ